MPERTIHILAKSAVTITRDIDGNGPVQGDVIGNALNGNAFSWENPSDLSLTFSGATVAITFEDSDGVLKDDPFSGSTVVDQRLTEDVTIDGVTHSASAETVRWQNPPPVSVENEYEVTLFDDAGTAYRMVGVSITEGYSTSVVGVMFEGPSPPPGTTLHYIQGVSSYGGSGQSVAIPEKVVCFLAGTRIETPDGAVAVETLAPGRHVRTLDRGPQPVRWIGRSSVCGLGRLAPVCISAGALGNDRDLFLSPNHRVLVRSSTAELWYGQPEVLVPAKALVDGVRIRTVPILRADYLHIVLDDHQMVFSEGIATETLFTGSITQDIMGAEATAELRLQAPRIDTDTQILSRMALTLREARSLLRSDARNGLEIVHSRVA